MRIDEINARLAEIRAMMENPDYDHAKSEELLAEVRSLNEERAQIEARAAQTAELRRQVGADTIARIQNQEEAARRGSATTNEEVRSGNAYAAAFLNAWRTGDETEARALLTTAVSGQIPVPIQLETEIRTAWEEHVLLSEVKHSYFRGDVKIGFELSATGASVHVEGAAAPDEEVVTIGIVTLSTQSIKKWITVSDEALENTTVDTVGYLYKEIAHKIVEKAEEILIGKITAAPETSDATHAGVPALKAAAIAADTIVGAVSLLAGQAKNLRLVMNRATYPAFVAVALAANYAIDVFDGLKERIVFSDALPAFSAASDGNTYAIVGDFANGAQANFPKGDTVTIKVDDMSLAEKDLVKIVGREPVGLGVVAVNHFVKITK